MIKLTPWPKSRWHPPRKIDIQIPGNTEFWVYITPRQWPRDPTSQHWALVIEERRPGEFNPTYLQERILVLRKETIKLLQAWLADRCPNSEITEVSWEELLAILSTNCRI